MIRRLDFVSAAAALACVPSLAAAQTPLVKLRMASAPDEDIAAALLAQSNGAFRKAGLDVDIQRGNSGSAVAAAVVGGSLEMGKSSMMSLINAHIKGLPLVLIASAALYNSDAPVVGMIVAKNSPLKTGKDFNGKILSVSSLNDQFQIAMSAWIDARGGDSATVKYLELPASAAPAAVATGRVDGATVANPILAEAVVTGGCRIIGRPFDAIAKQFTFAAYFTSLDFAAKNKDVVARFRKAIVESSTYGNAHPADTVDVVAKFSGIDAKTIAGMTRTTLGTSLDSKLIEPLIAAALRYKAIPHGFDPREMIEAAGA